MPPINTLYRKVILHSGRKIVIKHPIRLSMKIPTSEKKTRPKKFPGKGRN